MAAVAPYVRQRECAVSKTIQPTTSHARSGGVFHFGEHNLSADRVDPYQVKGKYREPTVCSGCHAVFHAGRWTWGEPPAGVAEARCPACRRIRDKLPAGTLVLEGSFVEAHRDELVRLIRHEAERERNEHPQHRVMEIAASQQRVNVATTDIHLPQRLGEALRRAYDGELTVRYGQNEYSARAFWRR
jgi:hypothetical protein